MEEGLGVRWLYVEPGVQGGFTLESPPLVYF